MSDTIKSLRADLKSAEEKAAKIQAERDEALAKLRDRFDQRLRDANDDAAAAQKKLCDAEALQGLRDRDDIDEDAKRALAEGLNLAW